MNPTATHELDPRELDDEAEAADDAASTYLTFELGGQTLGVEVRHVREILDLRPITRLPNAPVEVEGVVDVRGASVPIVDLAARLGLARGEPGPDARIVVIEIEAQGGRRPLGVLADRVRDVDRIGADEIEAAPGVGSAWDASMLKGLTRRGADLVVLLDLDRVFGARSEELDLSEGVGLF